jgi:hypothetical protein
MGLLTISTQTIRIDFRNIKKKIDKMGKSIIIRKSRTFVTMRMFMYLYIW